jgi:protein-S-isoprenylcysteine O-methyltransferase Ste14
MAQSRLSRADRFYLNPVLRDQEWNRAKQASGWALVVVLACIIIGFIAGVYADKPYSLIGWLIGTAAILIHFALAPVRRARAREKLRRAHGQT